MHAGRAEHSRDARHASECATANCANPGAEAGKPGLAEGDRLLLSCRARYSFPSREPDETPEIYTLRTQDRPHLATFFNPRPQGNKHGTAEQAARSKKVTKKAQNMTLNEDKKNNKMHNASKVHNTNMS